MKALTTAIATAVMLTGVYVTGCSHETSHHETDTTSPNGSMEKNSTSTYQNPDGSTTTVHQKDTNNP